MYELYKQQCSEKDIEPVKSSYYRHIFVSEFNLDFHRPKKERCDVCEAYKVKAEEGALTDEDKRMKEEHDGKKQAMRDERKQDRELKEKNVAVVSFDLQNVITCPRAEVSCFFYKRKLNVYNETAVSISDGKNSLFVLFGQRQLQGEKATTLPVL